MVLKVIQNKGVRDAGEKKNEGCKGAK